MAKRRKLDPAKAADTLSELLELAERVGLPPGVFDGDVEDECSCEAKEKAREINSGTLMGQLEFLLGCGFDEKRLAELIEEAAKGE